MHAPVSPSRPPAGALLALAALCACSREPEGPADPPPIVLITLDTVRADHLGCYGYPRATTPELDLLAAVSDRYTNAISTAPWTVPSHASMFTGLYSFQHGAEATDEAPEWATQNARPLAQEFTTLAEALKAQGYATAGFITNTIFLAERFGFAQGFDAYQTTRKPGVELDRDVFRWLDERRAPPFFVFVNYMDAHRPYNQTPPKEGERAGLPAPPADAPGPLLDRFIEAVMAQEGPFPTELAEQVTRQYDYGIANVDRAVGGLIEKLKQMRLFDEALIIVTADHGEYLGEHRIVEHNKDVYQPGVAVPLIVKRPHQREGRVVAEPVSLASLPRLVATFLPEAQRRALEAQFPAQPTADVRLAEIYWSRPNELKASWGGRFKRIRHAFFLEHWKYILSSDGQDELYDLAADPAEARNLVAEKPKLAAELRKRLEAFLARPKGPAVQSAPVQPTAAEHEIMKQLGYADSTDGHGGK